MLTAPERSVLRLLAQGHTAKTVATQTGMTVDAVNERLRAARRKTGTGSSRELARLLLEQEVRDQQIGIASNGLPQGHRSDSAAPSWASAHYWRPAMFITAAIAGAVIAYATAQPADNPANGSALSDDFPFTSAPDVEELHRLIQSEGRDEPWASGAEAALKNRYDALPHRAAARTVEIRCATTHCEVQGEVRPDAEPKAADSLMRELQSPPVNNAITEFGLTSISNAFGGVGEPPRIAFVSHWSRSDD